MAAGRVALSKQQENRILLRPKRMYFEVALVFFDPQIARGKSGEFGAWDSIVVGYVICHPWEKWPYVVCNVDGLPVCQCPKFSSAREAVQAFCWREIKVILMLRSGEETP